MITVPREAYDAMEKIGRGYASPARPKSGVRDTRAPWSPFAAGWALSCGPDFPASPRAARRLREAPVARRDGVRCVFRPS